MEKQRCVDKLLSVFNLTICSALGLPKGISTQVMLLYDRQQNRREFRLLDKTITAETHSKITSWLEANIDVDDLAHGLHSFKIDADQLQKCKESWRDIYVYAD